MVDGGRITTRGGGGGGGAGEGDREYVSHSGSTVVDLSFPGEFSIIRPEWSASLVTYTISAAPSLSLLPCSLPPPPLPPTSVPAPILYRAEGIWADPKNNEHCYYN